MNQIIIYKDKEVVFCFLCSMEIVRLILKNGCSSLFGWLTFHHGIALARFPLKVSAKAKTELPLFTPFFSGMKEEVQPVTDPA